MRLRPPAVPLVTIDPYFSIWSCADALHHDATRHWTVAPHELIGLARVDGKLYRFLGATNRGAAWHNARQPSGMEQTDLTITPTRTTYTFADAGVELLVSFCSPLLPDDLDLASRPFSYMTIRARSIDEESHELSVMVAASGNIATSDRSQPLVWERLELASGRQSMRIGTWEQPVLGHRGDMTTIDWGYLHLMSDGEQRIESAEALLEAFAESGSIEGESRSWTSRSTRLPDAPLLATVWKPGPVTDSVATTVVLGYEDIASIDYFGTRTPAYCFRDGATFASLAERAIDEWPEIERRCTELDEELTSRALESGGQEYAELIALAYRQSFAAHKLIGDEEGAPIFLSKECTSNGSIGTVDVAYPSTPLYLLLQPELVAAMLRPVFRFAESEAWPEPYAPHDVGTYPHATGQTYGVRIDRIDFSRQMPVEECGNMLIMTAAHAVRADSTDLAIRYWNLLRSWADYLLEYGLDPENQLCTDDFAGHLARNANLSIKAIMGIACFALLCDRTQQEDGSPFRERAQEYAARWMKLAADEGHTRLSFDAEGSWSLKYNLVWDRFFGFDLFPSELATQEVEWYLEKTDHYGTPLDSRASFTKTDWLVWAACLADDREKRDRLIEPIWRLANETPDRTPFTDWYDTHDGREQSFHNRTVIGGIAMPMLLDDELHATKRSAHE